MQTSASRRHLPKFVSMSHPYYSFRLKINDVLESLFCFYLSIVLKNQERIYYFFPILPLFNFLSYFNKYEAFFTPSQYELLIIIN